MGSLCSAPPKNQQKYPPREHGGVWEIEDEDMQNLKTLVDLVPLDTDEDRLKRLKNCSGLRRSDPKAATIDDQNDDLYKQGSLADLDKHVSQMNDDEKAAWIYGFGGITWGITFIEEQQGSYRDWLEAFFICQDNYVLTIDTLLDFSDDTKKLLQTECNIPKDINDVTDWLMWLKQEQLQKIFRELLVVLKKQLDDIEKFDKEKSPTEGTCDIVWCWNHSSVPFRIFKAHPYPKQENENIQKAYEKYISSEKHIDNQKFSVNESYEVDFKEMMQINRDDPNSKRNIKTFKHCPKF